MRLRKTTTLLLALAVGLAAGCGSDEERSPIPAESAAALERQLASIEDRFNVGGGACEDIAGGADPNTTAVQSVVDSLPDDVDPDVRQALQDGFDRLFALTEEQCDETSGQETTPEEPTETEEEPTETEEEPTETEEEGNGQGQGQGKSKGNNGGAASPEDDG